MPYWPSRAARHARRRPQLIACRSQLCVIWRHRRTTAARAHDEHRQRRSHSDAAIAFREFAVRPYAALSPKAQMVPKVSAGAKKVFARKGILDGRRRPSGFALRWRQYRGARRNTDGGGGCRLRRQLASPALDCAASVIPRRHIRLRSFEGERGREKKHVAAANELSPNKQSALSVDSVEDGIRRTTGGWRMLTPERIRRSMPATLGDDLFVAPPHITGAAPEGEVRQCDTDGCWGDGRGGSTR